MTTGTKTQPALEIRRKIAAPRERVFDAFAQKDQMEQWMCRDAASHIITYLKFDFREGGGFTLDIAMPGGEKYLQLGTYKQIVRPEKIQFLWEGEHYNSAGKQLAELRGTLVTFQFLAPTATTTEIVLTHEFLPDPQSVSDHRGGWSGCLDVLARLLTPPH